MIIITGTEGEIGKALADSFDGDVLRVDKHNCDLRDDKSIRLFRGRINKPVKGLINCAAISKPSYYGDLKTWDETFAVNVRAAFYFTSMIKDEMRDGGSIINITSINAEQAFPSNPAYVASKGALKMLTKAMALDWAHKNIRVNNVCPGYIKSGMTKKSWENEELRYYRTERTMLGRWGEPKDLIGICHFLMSDASSYITGADFVVDGGWIAKGL